MCSEEKAIISKELREIFVIEMAFDVVLEKLVKFGKYQIFGNH